MSPHPHMHPKRAAVGRAMGTVVRLLAAGLMVAALAVVVAFVRPADADSPDPPTATTSPSATTTTTMTTTTTTTTPGDEPPAEDTSVPGDEPPVDDPTTTTTTATTTTTPTVPEVVLAAGVDDAYVTDEDVPLEVGPPGVLANDRDPDGPYPFVGGHSEPAHGDLTIREDGSFTYVPDPDFAGTDRFTYESCVEFEGVQCTDTVVTITVVDVVDVIAIDDAFEATEDGTLVVAEPGVLGNDEPDPSDLVARRPSTPAHGELALNGDGSFTYQPDADFVGTDEFTYDACRFEFEGPSDVCDEATVTITVVDVVRVDAQDDAFEVDEDEALAVPADGVLDNDAAGDDELVVVEHSEPERGTAAVEPDGSLVYTPDADYFGPDELTYVACIPESGSEPDECDAADVRIEVIGRNDRPRAVDDAYEVDEDDTLTVPAPGVLGNDGDVDGDPLTASVATGAGHGTVTVAPDGSFVYRPEADYAGPDGFTYEVCDGELCAAGTVEVEVVPVNDRPVAGDDAYEVDEDDMLTVPAPGVLGNDGDVDGDPLTASVATGAGHGTVTVAADGSFVYRPEADYAGPDGFTYEVCDGELCAAGTVDIEVVPVNDRPGAVDDAYEVDEDDTLTVPAPGVLGNDGDVDGDPLTASVATGAGHGTVTVAADGSFVYRPEADYAGPDGFTYEVCDGELCAAGTVEVEVVPVNDRPRAGDDAYEVDEDDTLTVPAPGVLGNDGDVDDTRLVVELGAEPTHGTLELGRRGGFEYRPDPHFAGPDRFTYRVCDLHRARPQCDRATVRIVVGAVNDAPRPDDDAFETPEDTALVVTAPGVLDGDTDIEGHPLAVGDVAEPEHGTVAVDDDDGSLVYTPDSDYAGPDRFTYEVCDRHVGDPRCATATVTITVTPRADRPVAVDDELATAEDTAVVVDAPGPLANDRDEDGDRLTIGRFTDPAHGTIAIGPDGSLTYTPAPDFVGRDTFGYQSCAADGCDDAIVTILVTAVNDRPEASDDTYRTAAESTVIVSAASGGVLDNDRDRDGEPLHVGGHTDPAHGTVSIGADGSLRYTPDPGFAGVDRFTYRVCDGEVCDRATVEITVDAGPEGRPDPPVDSGPDGRPDPPVDPVDPAGAPPERPNGTPQLTLDPDVIALGDRTVAVARGCRADGPVDLTVESRVVGRATPVADGTFSVELDTTELGAGQHAVVAHCTNPLAATLEVAVSSNVGSGAGAVMSLATFTLALLGLVWRPLGRMN